MVTWDVEYTFSRLLGLNGVTKAECETDWASELYMLRNVETTGDYKVRFIFNTVTENSVNDFMIQCSPGVGMSGHEWDELSDSQKADWKYAIGTGSYILVDYVTDNYMTFDANPNYYGEDERYPGNKLPYVDTITLVYIADSANILTQFIAGELNWFGGQNSGLLNNSQMAQLRSATNAYTEWHFPSGSPSGIGLKSNMEPFSDKNVRIAMQHAINCEEIWAEYYNQTSELVIPGLWSSQIVSWSTAGTWSDELMSEYAYDPELAKQMLADAGYPNGFEFTIVCDPMTDTNLYVLVQSCLAAVGITMKIENVSEVMEHNAITTDDADPRCFNGFAGNFTKVADAYGMTCTGGFGYGLFHNNAEYDGLLASLQSADSLDGAAETAREMDLIYASEHWIITFGGATKISGFMSTRIGGYTGEILYGNSNMRTILSRLWVEG